MLTAAVLSDRRYFKSAMVWHSEVDRWSLGCCG